jgi:hypothetical protein
MSDERIRRIGLNEALFRAVNEQIDALTSRFGKAETIEIICECGYGGCTERLDVPLSVYESVRADSHRFLVVPGHEIPASETLVESTRAYGIVEKDGGMPADVAEKTDPRT